MQNPLRLAVLGDPHIPYPADRDAEDDWAGIIEDINRQSPHLVLIVGDLTGYGPAVGSPASLRHAVETLNRLDAPWFSVIGNHDLEAPEFETDAAAVASFLSGVERDTPWFRLDAGPISILGLSSTSFRRNPGISHEVVFEAEQLDWVEGQLNERADRPAFVLAHVPPIGSGLMTMAELHAHAGNAVANQNHLPGRIMKMVWQHPNILAWFSGHNHLGQGYRDSISVAMGVHFVHTGVARQTRDGCRHSRIVDIHTDHLEFLTLDHDTRSIDDRLRYREPHSLEDLLAWRRKAWGRLYIERDRETMRQGPTADRAPQPGT